MPQWEANNHISVCVCLFGCLCHAITVCASGTNTKQGRHTHVTELISSTRQYTFVSPSLSTCRVHGPFHGLKRTLSLVDKCNKLHSQALNMFFSSRKELATSSLHVCRHYCERCFCASVAFIVLSKLCLNRGYVCHRCATIQGFSCAVALCMVNAFDMCAYTS